MISDMVRRTVLYFCVLIRNEDKFNYNTVILTVKIGKKW
jgi:hypothetical protein